MLLNVGGGIRLLSSWQRVRVSPQVASVPQRINGGLAPPFRFIAVAMQFKMMAAAQGNGEFIADLATECAALGKAQVMGVARRTPADQTGLLRHKAHMTAIAMRRGSGCARTAFSTRLCPRLPFWLRRIRLGDGRRWGIGFRLGQCL